MLYKPNFCCNCGEKIERAQWSLFTSRRFCGICETEFKGTDYLARAAFAIASLIMIVGAASYLRSGPRSAGPEHTDATARRIAAAPVSASADRAAPVPSPNPPEATPKPSDAAVQPSAEPNSLQRHPTQKPSTETVYYCGALTKKGTSCTRRVKTKGRCWQHQGMPAAEEFR